VRTTQCQPQVHVTAIQSTEELCSELGIYGSTMTTKKGGGVVLIIHQPGKRGGGRIQTVNIILLALAAGFQPHILQQVTVSLLLTCSLLLTFVGGGPPLLHPDARPAACLPPRAGGRWWNSAAVWRSIHNTPRYLSSPTCGDIGELARPAGAS
jgi:hypothetical protein